VAGSVTHLSGTLVARKDDGSARILAPRSEVHPGETLATADGTYARVKFVDGGEVTLRPDSQLNIASYTYEQAHPERDNVVFKLLKGGLRSITGLIGKREPTRFQMNTATATIGIRGTIFNVLQCSNDCGGIKMPDGGTPTNGLHVEVGEGAISVTNNQGTQVFNAGQFGYVRDVNTAAVTVPPQVAPKPPPPPATFETGKAGVGKASADECKI